MRKLLNLETVLVIALMFPAYGYTFTQTPAESLKTVADCLVKHQNSLGTWDSYEYWNYTGPIVAGLVQAYEITNNVEYKNTAEKGADFIILFSELNFLGDEAYALARLGEVTENHIYTDIVRDFYDSLDTYKYIRGYNNVTAEKAVFYISFHAVASHMVDANDAEIWRESLVKYLAYVDDDLSYFPVMTLGVATWSLAMTGPMDDTLIDPLGLPGLDYWEDVSLNDLPGILSTHQVLYGEHAGSFYVRYDHTAPSSDYYESGYTEDAIFGLFGLISANNYREDITDINGIDPNNIIVIEDANDPDVKKYKLRLWDFDEEIQNARDVLVNSISTTGMVKTHIWDCNLLYYFLGGEMLEIYDRKYIYPNEE